MKTVYIVLTLITVLFVLKTQKSRYQNDSVIQHSFEMAGFKKGLHKMKTGNFYFYIKNPESKNFFMS